MGIIDRVGLYKNEHKTMTSEALVEIITKVSDDIETDLQSVSASDLAGGVVGLIICPFGNDGNPVRIRDVFPYQIFCI